MAKARPVVIHGGTLIDAASDRDGEFDLLIEEGKVKAIEKPGVLKEHADAERIDANKQWVMPGCIDLHVHLREPGEEWKETVQTGAEAAALGAAAGAAPLKFCTRVSSAVSSAAVSLSKPAAFLCSALSVCVKLLARALVRAKQRQRKSVAADLMR